jgi:hypothetical protein
VLFPLSWEKSKKKGRKIDTFPVYFSLNKGGFFLLEAEKGGK